MAHEQYVYILRLIKEDYSLPHVKAFLDRTLADTYFDNDVKFHRKKGWSISGEDDKCGSAGVARRAVMVRKGDDGEYESMTLLMEALEITKN
jgi:hypothetical protein